jgi:cytochrome c
MNLKALTIRILVLVGLLASASLSFAQESPPDSEKAKEIVALVEKAAALVATKGKAAFAEFKKPGTEWRHDDIYLLGTT